MKIYKSMEDLIGATPMVELRNIEQEENLAARLLVKIEKGNPAGSVKDRVAKTMLDDAEAKGKLTKGGTVIEPTSGNTGIGIAAEDMPRIFEKGFTGCNGRSDQKASGIGLYLCRRICRNLGHSIGAESVPGRGTTIRIGLARYDLKAE